MSTVKKGKTTQDDTGTQSVQTSDFIYLQ